jgi:tRNA(Ile)-lysidine synthase TilS/MesJ
MEIKLAPGKYVVAVSGGVDSVVLLNLLKNLKNVEVIVAHFDHGIRPDSNLDRKLVQKLAANYDLTFVNG